MYDKCSLAIQVFVIDSVGHVCNTHKHVSVGISEMIPAKKIEGVAVKHSIIFLFNTYTHINQGNLHNNRISRAECTTLHLFSDITEFIQ